MENQNININLLKGIGSLKEVLKLFNIQTEKLTLDLLDEIVVGIETSNTISEKEKMEILLNLSRLLEEEKEDLLAIHLYHKSAHNAFDMDYVDKKGYVIESVLGLSRLQFMRGITVDDTLELERKSLEFINEANVTPKGALLLLFSGMDEQFYGNAEEGYRRRTKALNYIQEFGLEQFEESVVQLVGWHFHLEGKLAKGISYYERYTLSIENKSENKLASLAYPAVIFGYFYTGQYEIANVLSTILLKKALSDEDYRGANLIRSILARSYTYMLDYDTAEKILNEALLEGEKINYGWGIYYAYIGFAFLAYKKGELEKSRKALERSRRTAEKYKFSYMFTAPFILDVIRDIKKQGLKPIDDIDYYELIDQMSSSRDNHLRGVSYRHLGDIYLYERNIISKAQFYYSKSIELLENSGDTNEIGKTYLSMANAYKKMQHEEEVKKAATNAWKLLNAYERKNFPEEYNMYIFFEDKTEKLKNSLNGLWLDMKDIVDRERLIQNLITNLGKDIKAESGLFAIVEDGKPRNVFSQNIIFDEKDGLIGETDDKHIDVLVIDKAIKSKAVSVNYQREQTEKNPYEIKPYFSMALPIQNGGSISAILYFQSKFKNRIFGKMDIQLIDDFIKRISNRINDIIDFSPSKENLAQYEIATSKDNILEEKNYYRSQNEDIVFLESQIDAIGKTNIPILISGETGTGKEVFAKRIYDKGEHKKNFIVVNCGAIPESLMESELFGYEKGSFTGAVSRKKGYFELAEGGTIFLDEIGELPLYSQVKLLRVIQEREFMRVGGTEPIKVNFRLIAATNRNLKQEVDEGRFRADLYYRLNVIQLRVPSLRERKEDIIGLSKYFVQKYCEEFGKEKIIITDEAEQKLCSYSWPGNIRELENTIERAVALSKDGMLDESALEERIKEVIPNDKLAKEEPVSEGLAHESVEKEPEKKEEKFPTLEELERQHIILAIKRCNGKISGVGGAAEILGINRNTLNSRMKKLNISIEKKN